MTKWHRIERWDCIRCACYLQNAYAATWAWQRKLLMAPVWCCSNRQRCCSMEKRDHCCSTYIGVNNHLQRRAVSPGNHGSVIVLTPVQGGEIIRMYTSMGPVGLYKHVAWYQLSTLPHRTCPVTARARSIQCFCSGAAFLALPWPSREGHAFRFASMHAMQLHARCPVQHAT